jgi:hypothetical protein
MTEDKPVIHLCPVNAPQMQKSKKVSLAKTSACLGLFQLIRKVLGLTPDTSLFLYYKQFAIYPETTVGDILEHTPGITELDIHYSLSPQFG